mgnify:CR=1 FL=1
MKLKASEMSSKSTSLLSLPLEKNMDLNVVVAGRSGGPLAIIIARWDQVPRF